MPERHVNVAASKTVFRRIGKLSTFRIYPPVVIRRRVSVRGHVQGVFFRETTLRRAEVAGVAGWVANTPEGAVEAVLEGKREAVEAVVAFMREGPRGARVDWVDIVSEEPEGLTGFGVR